MFYTRKLMFVLLLCTCLGAYAQSKRWESMYDLCPNLSVDKVKTTSKKTDVYFTFTAGTSRQDRTLWLSNGYRLIDSKGKVYRLLSAKKLDKGKTMVDANKKKKFRLSFSPLDASETLFDITSADGPVDHFRFFGLHQGNSLPSSPSESYEGADSEHLCKTPFDVKKKYKTCIIGHVEDPHRWLKQLTLEVLDMDQQEFHRFYEADIDSAGYFKFNAEIHSETLTYLTYSGYGTYIPVYLFPNDTLMVNISNFGVTEQVCQYKSLKNNEVPVKLLRSNPIYPTYSHVPQMEWFPEKQLEIMERAVDNVKTYERYIAGKYNLSKEEREMLNLNILLRIEVLKLCFMRDTIQYAVPKEFHDITKLFSTIEMVQYIKQLQMHNLLGKVFPTLKRE